MTWVEWLRAILTFDRVRRRAIDDLKLGAFLTASLTRRKRMPTLRQWMLSRGTRKVVGAELEQLRSERRYIVDNVMRSLSNRKTRKRHKEHGTERNTR